MKQDDSGLRLLNFQNNLIGKITNLANLPNLIFLDLYNNRIDTLEVSLAATSGLRVIMAGKNRIDKVRLRSFRSSDERKPPALTRCHGEGVPLLQTWCTR